MKKQNKASKWLEKNAGVLEEALLYWSAKEYNDDKYGEKLIAELFSIAGLPKPEYIDDDLTEIKTTANLLVEAEA